MMSLRVISQQTQEICARKNIFAFWLDLSQLMFFLYAPLPSLLHTTCAMQKSQAVPWDTLQYSRDAVHTSSNDCKIYRDRISYSLTCPIHVQC